MNENGNTTYKTYESPKWMPIVLNAYTRKQRSEVNNFLILPKALEKGEQAKPQVSSWEEIIKITVESNKIETDMKDSTKNKRVGYLKKIKKNDKTFSPSTQKRDKTQTGKH